MSSQSSKQTSRRYVADIQNGQARKLHRLATVRRQQGLNVSTLARRWDQRISVVRAEEDETSDLTLSQLYRWQQILEVPVADLLMDDDAPLSFPVMRRTQLLRLMKTAVTIGQKARSAPIRRLAKRMMNQLTDIMPELANVGPWDDEVISTGPETHTVARGVH
jgi:hypothetical protein